MDNISAIIVLKQNPPYALRAIASLDPLAQEIIVADLGIDQDLKKMLLKNKKVKIIQINKDVPYIELIKDELKKETTHEYVLYHDPDELFPKETISFIKENLTKYDIFTFPRKNIILGKWIEHSRWWPDYQVRLFKKSIVTWPKKLHAEPEKKGQEYTFEPTEQNAILHYNYDSLDEYLMKAMRYAKAEAQESLDSTTSLSLRITIQKSISEFVSRYFAAEGFKDGMHGFTLSFLQMFYCFLVYFYYWEGKKYQSKEDNIQKETSQFFYEGLYQSLHWRKKKLVTKVLNSIKKFI